MEQQEKKCYLGFIDILGFGDFVLNNPFEVVQNQYDRIVRTATLLVTETPKFVKKDDRIFAEGDPSNLSLNLAIFSDSIIVWTNDLEPASFRTLLFKVKNFILAGVSAGFPVRCGVSIGDLDVTHDSTLGDNIHIQTKIIGSSLVKAASLEKIQNWSGCIIDPEAILQYDCSVEHAPYSKSARMRFITGNPIIIQHLVPINRYCEQIEEKHFVLNWPWGIREEVPEHIIEQSFRAFHPEITESVQLKITNTLEYYRSIRGWTGVAELPDSPIHIE